MPEAQAESFGRMLDSAAIQTGLRELNKDFAFDVAVNRPDDWVNVVQFSSSKVLKSVRENRLPVMHLDDYICGLDRGMVTEQKQWSVKEVIREVSWNDADRDDVSIQYVQILPSEEGYQDLLHGALHRTDPSLTIGPGGILVRRRCMAYQKVRGRALRLGWRHTFENIIRREIRGAGRREIAEKFGVNLMNFPVGTRDELVAALVEE